jgi:hypothetical protein
VIAAATDLTFSLYGYAAVLGNDFLTALYLILVKNTPATAGLTTTGLLFYNAALSLPLLGVAVAVSPEPAGFLAYPDAASRGFRVSKTCLNHIQMGLSCDVLSYGNQRRHGQQYPVFTDLLVWCR